MDAESLATGEAAATALAWTLLHSFWQGAILWAAIRIVTSRAIDPRARFMAGNAAISLLLVAQLLTFAACLHWRSSPRWWDRPAAPVRLTELGLIERPPLLIGGWLGSAVEFVDPLLPWILAAWATWAGARLVAQIRAASAVTRVISLAGPLPPTLHARCIELARAIGVRRPVRFIAAAISDAPGTFGWLRPCVFVPPALLLSMTPAQLEAFVAHELAHIVRRDYAIAFVAHAVDACYACNPFVRSIVGSLERDAELCCDRLAVEQVGDAVGYAEALATLAERVAGLNALRGANGGSLKERVLSLLDAPPRRRRQAWPRTTASIVTAAVGFAAATTSLANMAARESDARWLATRSLTSAVSEILAEATALDKAPIRALLALAADRSAAGEVLLTRTLLEPGTFSKRQVDGGTRDRLLSAVASASDRTQRVINVFDRAIGGRSLASLRPETFADLSRSAIAQQAVLSQARVQLSLQAREGLARDAIAAVPTLASWAAHLVSPASPSDEWQRIESDAPRRVARPVRSVATRPR